MAVYLLRPGTLPVVKIGKAHDPEARLLDLQVAHWERLELLRVWEGNEAEEDGLHIRFADNHLRGDWFTFTKAMLGDVGLVQLWPRFDAEEQRRVEAAHIWAEASSALNDALIRAKVRKAEVARAAAVAPSTVQFWCNGTTLIPTRHAQTVSRVFGIPLAAIRPDIWTPPANDAEAA